MWVRTRRATARSKPSSTAWSFSAGRPRLPGSTCARAGSSTWRAASRPIPGTTPPRAQRSTAPKWWSTRRVDHHFGAVLLCARGGVVPGIGLDAALHVEEPALAQVLPGNLGRPAENDQAVELGLLLAVARLVLAHI